MKPIKQILFLSLVVPFLVISCHGSDPQPEEQSFHIVPVYLDMLDYIQKAREVQDPALMNILQTYVIEPNREQCSGEEYLPPPGSVFDTPIEDLDALEKNIRVLAQSDVEELVRGALERSALALSGPDTTVCIVAADPSNWFIREKMNGVNGWTYGAGKIIIQINPVPGWRSWVPYIVAHEYHHSAWTARFYPFDEPEDLLDRIIFEGKADSFAHIVYPEVGVPWVNALTPAEEQEQWRRIQVRRETTDALIKGQFMVGEDKDTPTWTGYTIGYHIVQSYLRHHPEADIQTWTALPAVELLEQSGYQK